MNNSQQQIIDSFTDVPVYNVNGEDFTVIIDKDVNFDKEAVYVNVQKEYGDIESRGEYHHTLRFIKKEILIETPTQKMYRYTFKNVSHPVNKIVEYVESHHGGTMRRNVTIQPWNIFHAKFLDSLDSHRQLTFSVSSYKLFEQGETYVIRSYCLDKYVKGTAKCITARRDTLHGDIATFELNPIDYVTFSTKRHCRFSFAKKTWIPFETQDWLQFKKRKSVKKCTKTVVKKTSKRRLASPKRVVKNVKKQTKRSRPVKNE